MKSRYFEFTQNDSGNYFDCNENVGEFVIIEACSKEEAIDKFKLIANTQHPICGESWNFDSIEEIILPLEVATQNIDYSNDEDVAIILERWKKIYNEYDLIELQMTKHHQLKSIKGRIRLNNIDEYCKFTIEEYGYAHGATLYIHYLNGIKNKYQKTKIY